MTSLCTTVRERDRHEEFDKIVDQVAKAERQKWKQGGGKKTSWIEEKAKPRESQAFGFFELDDAATAR